MRINLIALTIGIFLTGHVQAANARADTCERPAIGSEIVEPVDLRSHDGILKVNLIVRNSMAPNGSVRYCYLLDDGSQSPTLRVSPGDVLEIHLKNALTDLAHGLPHGKMHPTASTRLPVDPCSSGLMSVTSTNLHFHGMSISPVCHQDEVLATSIQPGDAPFQYRFKIPLNQPPGLYWYHPHIHGVSKAQVLGGASGALVVEGLERANHELAGLPERVLIIRDQDLLNPTASPSSSEPVVPKTLIDRDGDSANNGMGFGRPAKDLSINYVPVPYPEYPPATLRMAPGERQLWRVLNASAITYLNLALLIEHSSQQLGIVAIDGVPLNQNGNAANAIEWRNHIGIPPGSRVEFVVTGPPAGTTGLLVTRSVDTGQGGENDPNRALAKVTTENHRPLHSRLADVPSALPQPTLPWLGDVTPTRTRKLYFSEKLLNPDDPNSATEFYLTIEGETPAAFDPSSREPNIVVKQGDVEDWIIENRSNELHDFHIHQTHFLLLEWSGTPVDEPFLRDTVNVPFFTNRMLQYPSVRLRMDFRDPLIIGTFVYHCHLLEHEDGGMMGTIRVEAANPIAAN
jgi:FtsP/CotA-like multicopper oxidase with cupredoxin domain